MCCIFMTALSTRYCLSPRVHLPCIHVVCLDVETRLNNVHQAYDALFLILYSLVERIPLVSYNLLAMM